MEVEKITWIDSYTNDADSWKDVENLDKHVPLIVSIGYVYDRDKFVCVVPHTYYGEKTTQICGEMYIPKAAITDRKIL